MSLTQRDVVGAGGGLVCDATICLRLLLPGATSDFVVWTLIWVLKVLHHNILVFHVDIFRNLVAVEHLENWTAIDFLVELIKACFCKTAYIVDIDGTII